MPERKRDERPHPEPASQAPRCERLLIYDGECRFCLTAKQGLERLGGDRDVRFVPYQSEEAARRLGPEYRPGRPDVAFLVEADGRISRGLDAFLPLLAGLRGGRALQALLRLPGFRPLAYLLYRLIARYRYRWFGRIEPEDCA
ncbi:thiol-disulfide oxidoreductase DCC family protein [Nitrospira sp. Kam-Ns4a]